MKKINRATEAWDVQVMEAMKSIGAPEGLLQVAVDVCDSLLVSSVIHSRHKKTNEEQISFVDIFNQVSIGVREQNQNMRIIRGELKPEQFNRLHGL